MKGTMSCALLVVCFAPLALSAQVGLNPLSIAAGTRARITSGPETRNYVNLTVVNVDRDSLRYHLPNDETTKSVAWNQITRMEVSQGTHRRVGRGVGIGLLVGGVIGGFVANATANKNDDLRGLAIASGVIGGAVGGAIIGGVLGFAQRSERWASVALNH